MSTQLNPEQVLNDLRYIADSPPHEHGGFYPNAVEAAKNAIELIESLLRSGETRRV